MSLRQILYTVNFLVIIIVSQIVLMSIPNVQLTTVLFLVYFSRNTIKDSIILIVSYSTIMGIIWGFTIFLIPMLITWILSMSLYKILKTNNEFILAFEGILIAIILGFTYGIFNLVIYSWNLESFKIYMIADIPYQLIMATTNFLTILWLFNRLKKLDEKIRFR